MQNIIKVHAKAETLIFTDIPITSYATVIFLEFHCPVETLRAVSIKRCIGRTKRT